jgi:hypothetical protein
MITVVQRSESDTAGIGEGSLCCVIGRGSFCKGLAGLVYLYDCSSTRRHERRLAGTAPSRFSAKNSPLSIDASRRPTF